MPSRTIVPVVALSAALTLACFAARAHADDSDLHFYPATDNSINVQLRASLQARDQIVLIPWSLPPNTCVYEFASTRKFV
jgi:hypothetical protein